jgi:gamma-glutamylcyclotransferase (GGCT)/AIG2-like uncharacterized protein YtfP
MKVNLFTYGTLSLPEVMRAVAGRDFATADAHLDGYRSRLLKRHVYPGMVHNGEGSTHGVLYYGVDAASLARIDAFEGAYYRRETVLAVREDGSEVAACTYVLVDSLHHLLSVRDWDEEEFRRKHLQHYLRSEE